MPLLDVVLGYDCNLACTYCTITPEMRRRAMPTERVAREIDRAAARGFRDVAFTGGEPTLRADLPALVKHARRRGFAHVKVASNGLRYAHAAYLDHLIACGVDRFHISLHAFEDDTYERTVRLAGTAVMRTAALANLASRAVDPVADLILKEDTYRSLEAWIERLVLAGVRRFALWLVSLTDENRGNAHQLPRISAIAPYLVRAFEAARRGGYEVVALHVPRCFLPGYEEHVRHPGAELVTVVTPDDVFDLRDSRLGGGVKPEGCRGCVHENRCPGLRSDYVEIFGGAEVAAVRAGESSAPSPPERGPGEPDGS
jgi:MoaA/NifB/PqqE/SkfB family radical SAM enzyme